ncbi:hypothetical protein BV25DRAFT_1916496 [Artomyces pyxidatus]|uniref:Uncharacterized protein n=1 Tax=Artomyces pyxidatus TaxID=48021 RepID=A0ACB8T0Y2_9AGAM|nr:hypothetical protein BV25DRAFT_1916496 [Artomyces pyxidatus]
MSSNLRHYLLARTTPVFTKPGTTPSPERRGRPGTGAVTPARLRRVSPLSFKVKQRVEESESEDEDGRSEEVFRWREGVADADSELDDVLAEDMKALYRLRIAQDYYYSDNEDEEDEAEEDVEEVESEEEEEYAHEFDPTSLPYIDHHLRGAFDDYASSSEDLAFAGTPDDGDNDDDGFLAPSDSARFASLHAEVLAYPAWAEPAPAPQPPSPFLPWAPEAQSEDATPLEEDLADLVLWDGSAVAADGGHDEEGNPCGDEGATGGSGGREDAGASSDEEEEVEGSLIIGTDGGWTDVEEEEAAREIGAYDADVESDAGSYESDEDGAEDDHSEAGVESGDNRDEEQAAQCTQEADVGEEDASTETDGTLVGSDASEEDADELEAEEEWRWADGVLTVGVNSGSVPWGESWLRAYTTY